MRALIVSSDRFEDGELSEPLQQLQAKGVEVDIAAPQQRPITGKHGHRVSAGVALSAVRAEDYDLLLLPGGEAPASLRKIPGAVAIARHFLQADKPRGRDLPWAAALDRHRPHGGTHRHLLSRGETGIGGRSGEQPGPRGGRGRQSRHLAPAGRHFRLHAGDLQDYETVALRPLNKKAPDDARALSSI